MIARHRGAFEYDWRARFGCGAHIIGGDEMTWGEAWRLTHILATDPGSQVAAALADWSYPLTREALAVMDLYDLMHHVAWLQGGKKGSKPRPYPRPAKDAAKQRRRPGKDITQQQIIAALREAGHTAPVPDPDGTSKGRG